MYMKQPEKGWNRIDIIHHNLNGRAFLGEFFLFNVFPPGFVASVALCVCDI